MHDARVDELAKLLVEYSTRLKRNENVLIEAFDVPDEMTIALIRAARKAGATPFVQVQRARIGRELALEASDRQLTQAARHELARMKKMHAYIALRGSNNITELSDVPVAKMQLVAKKMRPVQDQRVKKTKWVVLRWPTPSMAQLAGMSTQAFEDFYFEVCTLDYRQGKIVEATSNQTEKLNKILDSDAGARYIGEFSLGFNPHVLEPMRDILFDEKIAGSFHFTPGQAYEEADNGNRSQVHWDMVNIQRREYGGGEVYFDGKLIRRDGEFLPKQLRSLNRSAFSRSMRAAR